MAPITPITEHEIREAILALQEDNKGKEGIAQCVGISGAMIIRSIARQVVAQIDRTKEEYARTQRTPPPQYEEQVLSVLLAEILVIGYAVAENQMLEGAATG